jgi:hypothetical protein
LVLRSDNATNFAKENPQSEINTFLEIFTQFGAAVAPNGKYL